MNDQGIKVGNNHFKCLFCINFDLPAVHLFLD